MPLDPELLKILVCPACKSPVQEEPGFLQCTNHACSNRYPVRDGIPIMLIEEATKK